jgi:hypothetical protein
VADTVQQLVDDVLNEGSFDATAAQALRWLNRRHRTMVARSRCYRFTTTLTTVAGQRDYALPTDVVEIFEVSVNGMPAGRARHVDLALGALSYVILSGDGRVMAPEEDSSGGAELGFYPTPDTSGQQILVRAAFLPPDLDTANNATLKVPGDFVDALVSGAMATALERAPGDFRPDLADRHAQRFEAACEELRRRVSRRYRGSAPAQIRVQGINA